MINIKQWNVKQIVIGILICVMASAVLISVPSAQVEVDPSGFAWELRLVPQDSGVVVERDMWLVDDQGEMIDVTLATFSANCESTDNGATVDGDSINLSGGAIVCNLPGAHMNSYNNGGDGWPGVKNLWGITVCNYSNCDLPHDYLHQFSIETTALPSDDTTEYGAFLHYSPFNRTRSVMLLNPSAIGWATRLPNRTHALSQVTHNWGNTADQVYLSSSCPNDGTPCDIDYSINGTMLGSFPSNLTAYRHNMYGVLYVGVGAVSGSQLGRFHGEVESMTIRGLTCETCSN